MVNWPPAPVKPISEPNRIDFLSYSIFQLISFRATRAGGIMVSDQTTYPRVGGKPAFSVISINAPQTPQNRVVIRAKTSQIFDFIRCRYWRLCHPKVTASFLGPRFRQGSASCSI